MNQNDFTTGAQLAWADFISFMPKLLLAAIILVAGYFVAKLACRFLHNILDRVKFDRAVERGGIKRALSHTNYTAAGVLSTVLFYAVMLFVLQLAFGVFGANPVSNLLTEFVAFLPNIFAALVITIVTAAIASAVKDIVQTALAGVSYGRILSGVAAAFIYVAGLSAALNQINIAPAIVNGIFYAILAIVAGSAIIAIGGGGIGPMRRQWERMFDRVERDAPRLQNRGEPLPTRAQETQKLAPEPARGRTEAEQRSFPE